MDRAGEAAEALERALRIFEEVGEKGETEDH